ncbi:MAG: peptidyl-prolyl cis-trans isomerase [Tepidisphaeraceae bacterium]|jgi:hypothetical protein
MRKFVAVMLIGSLPLVACRSEDSSSSAPPVANGDKNESVVPQSTGNQVLAEINGEDVTLAEIEPVLLDGYGLKVLLEYIELHLIRQEAAKNHIVITPQDIAHERELSLEMVRHVAEEQAAQLGQATSQPATLPVGPAETEQLLDRALASKDVTRPEFENVLLEVNATLRKLVEPSVQAEMTDDAVRQQFNATYGEKAVVRYVVFSNMPDAQVFQQAVSHGRSFEDAASASGLDVREFQPFTRADTQMPDLIKQVVFGGQPGEGLKPGDTSDPTQLGQSVLIMKLMELIPPQHAKFEDYKDAVRQDLYEQKMNEAMNTLNTRLGKDALATMEILQPDLKKQWDDRRTAADIQEKSADEIRKQMDEARTATAPSAPESAAPPTTEPAPMPSTAPAGG